MRTPRIVPIFVAASLVAAVTGPVVPASATGAGITRSISRSGTAILRASVVGSGAYDVPEFAGADAPGDEIDPSTATGKAGVSVNARGAVTSNPELVTSFDGLSLWQQRTANGGNQFSVEPPDQGLCAGNGYVVESVNTVLRVFDTSGRPLTGVVDLNTFYGYPAQFNRATDAHGPLVADPSCLFDQPTQRWFHVVLTIEVRPNTGKFLGPNHLDLAVSNTSDPTGAWTIYRLPVQDDGSAGTPNHHCAPGRGSEHATNATACVGDYPHIGADAHGVYLTTNEYDLFGPSFRGAQVYAFSKAQLASLPASVDVTQFDLAGADPNGNPAFTVWPAQSPGTASFDMSTGGTEYFLSSDAAEEANGTGSSTHLMVWALTNTSSLNDGTPALALSVKQLTVGRYGIPPKSEQKPGDFPLGQCLNDRTIPTPFGLGCWRFFFDSGGPFHEVESRLDSNDTRMQQVMFAGGKLWGALDTAVTVGGENNAGIQWFVVEPSTSGGSLSARLALQGYTALENNNVTYPAIGVTSSGRGVMAFTVVGEDHYPSAGYASIDASGVGPIHIAAEGAGPDDGFTGYKAFVRHRPRTRWGDYGAAAVVGDRIWIASEYIAQTCSLATYVLTAFTCGGARAPLGNWATRVSLVSP